MSPHARAEFKGQEAKDYVKDKHRVDAKDLAKAL